YYPPEFVAAVWASVGEMDKAFVWMDRVLHERSALWRLEYDAPEFAPLHRDRRWAAFEQRAVVKAGQ
ncbi:MAG: hypothetical protein ACREBE_03465, partial [bacterium]